ncbi:hypothetical protein [Chryseolinea sp. H1M3-3]|uniref:hypothetical protein n=1 Tax=Chryseolinea sp. H1M3-3 TaxID=3034144 RepID=UPI0023ECF23B|nr:hypothetical protein [Chryseolinea sp. H1M3-3]
MKRIFLMLVLCSAVYTVSSQDKKLSLDSLGAYKIIKDKSGKILPWFKPEVPGAAYAHVCKLASEFIKTGTPIEPRTGLPLYLVTCCFEGPHLKGQQAFDAGKTGEDWMHNPAMTYAGMVHSLVMGYRVFSGDESYVKIVKDMLDYQLKHGTTEKGWIWPQVPYASSNPFNKEYYGATRWENDGMRGDGLHGIEPDKVGELGYAYLLFYEVTMDTTYLNAAIHCADALATNIRDIEKIDAGEPITDKSPWPFRINARNGKIIDEFCSNVVEPAKLFEELLRIRPTIAVTNEQVKSWTRARDMAWHWLYSKGGPMKTYIWNAYFEDVPSDPRQANRNQVTPMETARHILRNPHLDADIDRTIPALLHWVESAFGTEGMDAIKEQTWCYEPMGSHTARFASICALWYERTGDVRFKEKAYRYFNNATYSTDQNGVVRVGPTWPSSWFSDGYSDYIRHFLDGYAAVPEWVPLDQDHVLRSSSAIQKISYSNSSIQMKTHDNKGHLTVRMNAKPKSISIGNNKLVEKKTSDNAWSWTAMEKGGLLKINYSNGNEITVSK